MSMMTDTPLYERGPYVRVVSRRCDHPAGLIVVQARLGDGMKWVDMRTFDCMSDDYAHSNAREYAGQLVRKMQVFDELNGPSNALYATDEVDFASACEHARRIADAEEGFDD